MFVSHLIVSILAGVNEGVNGHVNLRLKRQRDTLVSMNETREKLLQLARRKDISGMGLRELARELGVKNPQNIKFHLRKLHEAGLLSFDEKPSIRIDRNTLQDSALIRIPILGSVSAGPATQIAADTVNGFINVSSSLLRTKNYKDLYALKVVGTSMNKANISVKPVNDGDYAIVDGSKKSPKDGEYVVAMVNELTNLKRFYIDRENEQVVLMSESTDDYSPIFVHPSDSNENLIRGTVVQVMRRPAL